MDVVLIIIGIILILIGIIGSVVPVLPGPPISFVALLLLQFRETAAFTWSFIVWWAVITVIVTVLDYFIPVAGTRRYGGTKSGMIGTFAGLVAGIFIFPPFGLIFGPIVGAWIGEVVGGKAYNEAYRPAFGSFMGFLAGTVLKLIASVVMAYYFFINI